jgi:FlaA1/EpsC-like NDP-sugar epimerase
VQAIVNQAHRIADFWQQAGARVQAFEQTLPPDVPVALYGAGFYGAFIASWLRQPQRIRHVIDQNAFLQGRQLHGAPVIAPGDLPADVSTLLVGLSPAHARQIVGDIDAFTGRSLNCFYL